MTRLTPGDWAAIRAHPDTALGPPATAAALDVAERDLGVSLPADHRALLLGGNGGVLGSVRLFGVGRPDALDLWRQAAANRAGFERTAGGPVLPFASDWGQLLLLRPPRPRRRPGGGRRLPGLVLEPRVLRGARGPAAALVPGRGRVRRVRPPRAPVTAAAAAGRSAPTPWCRGCRGGSDLPLVGRTG